MESVRKSSDGRASTHWPIHTHRRLEAPKLQAAGARGTRRFASLCRNRPRCVKVAKGRRRWDAD